MSKYILAGAKAEGSGVGNYNGGFSRYALPYKRSALFLHQQWILSLKADTYYTASLQPHLQQLGETFNCKLLCALR